MLRFFKTKGPLIRILFPIIAALFAINLPDEFISSINTNSHSIFYKHFVGLFEITVYSVIYKVLIGFFLTVNSFLFTNIILKIKLFKIRSNLHGFIFLFITGISVKYTDTLPVLTAMVFFLTAIQHLINTFRKKSAIFDLFNIGFFISIASFFSFNSIWFFPYIYIGLIILRTQNIREWLSSIIGLIVPYFFVFSIWFFIYSDFDIVFNLYEVIIIKEELFEFDMTVLISLTYIFLLALISTLIIVARYRATETDIQDYFRLFFMLFILSAVIFLIVPGLPSTACIFSLISISIPVSYFFYRQGKKIIREVFFDLFLLAVIVTQFDFSSFNF